MKNSVSAKKKHLSRNIAILIIAVLVLFSVISQVLITSGENGIQTEIALSDYVKQTVDADAFIVRDEKIISSDGANVVSAVQDSTRVGAGDTIAYSFSDSESAANIARMKEINELLEYYNELTARSSSIATNTDSYDSKIFDAVYSYSSMISSGKFSSFENAKKSLRDTITSKQTAVGTELDLSETIMQLRNEYTALNNKTASYSEIKSDSTGYYISGTDGYEKTLDYGASDDWTVSDVESALESDSAAISSSDIGRVVHGYYWYICCVTQVSDTEDLIVGDNYTVVFPDSSVGEVTAQIYRIDSDIESGKSLVIFRCNEMNEEVASLRIEKIQIVLDEISGYRIDNRAIRVNKNNEKGVYVVRGAVMSFRKIYIVYSTEDYTFAKNPPAKDAEGNSIAQSEYISLYDEYIVVGKNLSEGKIIKSRV